MDFQNKEKEFEAHYKRICGKNRRPISYETQEEEEKMKKMEMSNKKKEQLEKELRTAKCDLEAIRKSLGKYFNNICVFNNLLYICPKPNVFYICRQ